MKLPAPITQYIYQTLSGNVSLQDFEQWVYASKELEAFLSADDYLDLISLNYRKDGAVHALHRLLSKHVDLGDFERYKLLEMLAETRQQNENLPYLLMEFYALYCRGYKFLLALGTLGLTVKVPTAGNYLKSWEELTASEKQETLALVLPSLKQEIDLVAHWLLTGQIVPEAPAIDPENLTDLNFKDLRINP